MSNLKQLKLIILLKTTPRLHWKKIKGLLQQVEKLPERLKSASKLEISQQLDKIANVLAQDIVENEFIYFVSEYYLNQSNMTVKENTIFTLMGVLKRLKPKTREKYGDVYHYIKGQNIKK